LDGKSQAGEAFRNISGRMLGEDIPFMDLYKSKNVFGRIGNFIRSGGGEQND